ncbi:hypothetical protein PMAC_000093 [Pneumocystis sp. 'macacae']|nr:hypothetical protein PMAC_000093 [Pneumocystis sp. 'macacae']
MEELKDSVHYSIKEHSNTYDLPKKQTENSESSISVSKYCLFFYDLFTWKYPRNSGIVLGGIVTLLLFSSILDIPHLILRTAWIVFASSTIIEITGRSIFKQPNGVLYTYSFYSQFAPSSFYSISRESFNDIVDKICDLINFMLYGIQELLFARKIKYTAIAFIISWISFILVNFFSFVHIVLLATLLSFTIPSFYIKYQKIIDKNFAYISDLANKYSNIMKEHAGNCTETAIKELSVNFIKLGTKINDDINKFKNGFMKSKSLLYLKVKKTKQATLPKTSGTDVSTTQEILNEEIEKRDINVSITT